MKDLRIDKNGDLIFDAIQNDMETVTDELEDIKQSVQIVLETRLSEYVLDRELGLERMNFYLTDDNKVNPYLAEDIQNALIEQIAGVVDVKINDSIFNPENRNLEIKLTIEVDSGQKIETKSEVVINDI